MTLHGTWIRNRQEHAPDACVELARAAEEGGWDGVWVSDSANGADTPYWEPLTLLAAMAAVTERVSLGTWVMPLPARDVVAVARGAAVVGALAPGRVLLGLGLGNPDEHAAVGIDRAGIGARYDAGVEVLQQLLRDGSASRDDEWFDLQDVVMHVPPEVPPLLFAVQSEADAPVERAARFGGLVPFVPGDEPERMVEVVSRYRAAGGDGPVVLPRVADWGDAWDAAIHEVEPEWVLHCEDRDAAQLSDGPPALA